ncbi:hypothetical protein [Mycobacteroides abscessus]|uniref:hypothetical protein n=1 Tax=Mycobacteroides abscessus TaxID=36809 RepID=UPI0009A563CA|nr:hypothetical protein [Mycobacteroides abscessus]SKT21396.1 Uncharacterised protein [Mycobacteroides abscessus subsp. bolletii]SLF57120.1 Uncharacterised protein [Mycobacteroides abscessus subsp. bolletii]
MSTALSSYRIRSDQKQVIADQIGTPTICSVSGGRIIGISDGIELPVSNGFLVRVQLTAADDYTVTRIFKRKAKGVAVEYLHGQATRIYCDQLREFVYHAGMFRSFTAEEWPRQAAEELRR